MDRDDLTRLLVNGDHDEVMTGLTGLTDQERKKLGPMTRGWLTQGTSERIIDSRKALAVLATAGGARQAMIANQAWNVDAGYVADAAVILARRSPSWIANLVTLQLEGQGVANWQLVRELVRCGAVPAPDHPEYFRGTVRGVPDYRSQQAAPLAEVITNDPGLVGDHLISMLSTEGVGRLLAYHDTFAEKTYDHRPQHVPSADATWRQALVTLAAGGGLDRNRLFDAVLAAPLRDWAAADLGWYAGLHDALQPTAGEVLDRQETYARLLTAEHGPSVKLAQRELLRIFGAPGFRPDALLDASRTTLARTDKTSVTAHLRLLEKLAKAHPDVSIAGTVRIALDHPSAGVRDHAAKLLAKLGEDLPAPIVTGEFVSPAPEPRPSPLPVVPVASADELADVLLMLLEDLDPVELERAIDGLLRFATERPSTADVLVARASQTPYYGDPRIAAVLLTRAWLDPRKRFADGDWAIHLAHSSFPIRPAAPDTIVGALGRRLSGIAYAVRRGRQVPVALPRFADGSLDAETLSDRLAAVRRRQDPPELEVAIALLRVPREQRSAVIIPARLSRARSVARLLTRRPPSWERQIFMYQPDQWNPERKVPLFVDRSSRGGDDLAGFLARPAPERTLARELSYGQYEPRFEQTLAAAALVLPHDLDVLAAHAHPYLHRDLDKDRAVSVPVLDAIARGRVPSGAPESSALVLGLAAKDAQARTAAQDALIDLARHGLLDGSQLGEQAAAHLADGIVVGQRISNGLTDVVRASDAAVVPVCEALAAVIGILPGRRDAGPFIQLAADLAGRTGRKFLLPKDFRDLAGGKSSSLLAQAVRRLS